MGGLDFAGRFVIVALFLQRRDRGFGQNQGHCQTNWVGPVEPAIEAF